MKNRKEVILNMYFIEKLRPVDIAKKLDISKSAVTQVLRKDKRYVQIKQERKLKNQKKHIEATASVELSKGKRLSNMAYRNWNKSAYSYNEKKRRFEFKEDELGRSYDVPKYIKVEVL